MDRDEKQEIDFAEDKFFENVLDQAPAEFFEAMELGNAAVAEYLESDHPFSLYTRSAMALWLRGELKLPRGRPRLLSRSDEATKQLRLAYAVRRYRELQLQKRSDGSRMRGTAGQTLEEIAKTYRVPLNQLEAQLRRGKKTVSKLPASRKRDIQQMVLEMYADWLVSRKK